MQAILSDPDDFRHETTPSDKVYEFVLAKIKAREWLPNARIMTESELCVTLEVSRVAVREALERLAAVGLLVKKQGAGTFVAKPMAANAFNTLLPLFLVEEKDILTIMEFRKHFEYGTVRMFVRNHSAEELAGLERNYDEMVACRHVNPERSGMLDIEFHQLIANGTKNIFAIKTSQIVKEVMGSLQATMFAMVDSANAVEYHREIVKSIRRGHDDIAAMFMYQHIETSMEAVRHWLERGNAGAKACEE